MASSSSSPTSSSQTWIYDVFLSFRGEDTRKTFVDHLYSALEEKGIITYKDDATLTRGEMVGPALLKGIRESRIAVIVFSENYADSSWCLDELEYIMKCKDERGQIVMPIFYHVNPSHVRKQKGKYGEVFVKHELKNKHKIESWKLALAGVGSITGWETKYMANGHESKGIKEIVNTISKTLGPSKGLVGIQTHLEDLKFGSGGMTTIASSHEDMERLKIPLEDISLATNRFSEANIIAGGGFGKVYRGLSEQHGSIAVKQLDRSNGQGDREFMMEIALLSTYEHENLVSLVGYCDQDGEKILVYKYESNESLNKHVYSKALTWIRRLGICIDAASGLKYLHDDVGPHHRILHRDIKSYNILLDENFKAKISDFGLSKIALANVQFSTLISNPCGTRGYVDPLYEEHNILSQKSDVYSFGVVLFEVLCGKLVNSREYHDERHFSAKLAQNHYEMETLDDIIDSDLRVQMNSDSLSTFSTIAYKCLKKRKDERPTMSLVVDQLKKALKLQQAGKVKLNVDYGLDGLFG